MTPGIWASSSPSNGTFSLPLTTLVRSVFSRVRSKRLALGVSLPSRPIGTIGTVTTARGASTVLFEYFVFCVFCVMGVWFLNCLVNEEHYAVEWTMLLLTRFCC